LSKAADTKDNTKEKTKVNLESKIDKLDKSISASTENGLFIGNSEDKDKIFDSLKETRESLDKEAYSECERNRLHTSEIYTQALNSKGYRWRLFNLHAIHIWIYLVAILVAIFSIYYLGLLNCPVEKASNSISASGEQCYLNKVFGKDVAGFYAVTWGCIGAVFRGLWYLKQNVDFKTFQNSWNIYYLSSPFIGGILGAIIYFIIIGGIITVTTTDVNIQHAIPIIVFATLAGFNWEWALKLFRKIGDTLALPAEKECK